MSSRSTEGALRSPCLPQALCSRHPVKHSLDTDNQCSGRSVSGGAEGQELAGLTTSLSWRRQPRGRGPGRGHHTPVSGLGVSGTPGVCQTSRGHTSVEAELRGTSCGLPCPLPCRGSVRLPSSPPTAELLLFLCPFLLV